MIGEIEDISVKNALKIPSWKAGMEDEIKSLKEMKTWKSLNLAKGRKPLT